jgi:hypothetical protein
MKALVVLAISLSSIVAAHAADVADSAPEKAASTPAAAPEARANKYTIKPEDGNFCMYGGNPTGAAKYTKGRALETGRQTCGAVLDELPRFVATAKAAGADAVVNYNGAQHLGFWPWRPVRPLLTRVAIKSNGSALDCAASGGATYETVMRSKKEPPRKLVRRAAYAGSPPRKTLDLSARREPGDVGQQAVGLAPRGRVEDRGHHQHLVRAGVLGEAL